MHPHLKSLLVKAGCESTASDDDAKKFYDGMSAEKKAEIDGELAKLMDGDGDEAATSARPVPPPGGEPTSSLSAKQIADIATKAAVAAVQAINVDPTAKARLAAAAARGAPTTGKEDDDVALEIETKRVNRIASLGKLHGVEDGYIKQVIAKGGTFEDARGVMLKWVSDNSKPLASVRVGDDARITALRTAIPQAIIMRAGLGEGDDEKIKKVFSRLGETIHEQAHKLKHQTMLDMFRTYLLGLGVSPTEVYEMSRAKLAGNLGPRGLRQHFPRMAALAESTSDFANITLDAINKALRFNYLDAKRTWPIWCEKKFAPDFKTINSIALSEAPSMVSADEGAELRYVSLSDSKETAKLKTFKAGIRLARNAIINDDLDAFNAIPRLQANSAARLEDDTAYSLITTNANMADGNALFSSSHSNYTSSGGAPSIANLQVGSTAVKKQKGLAGVARLELEPKFLLVPSSIEESTKELIGSKTLIAQYTGGSSNPTTVGDNNPYFNRYQVVGSVRLDDNSATAWYLFADFRDGQVGVAQLYFLTDEPEPVLRQETDFDTEDVKYLVRHTIVGLVPEYRGAYKNAGS